MSARIDREVLLSLKHVEISFDNGGSIFYANDVRE